MSKQGALSDKRLLDRLQVYLQEHECKYIWLDVARAVHKGKAIREAISDLLGPEDINE